MEKHFIQLIGFYLLQIAYECEADNITSTKNNIGAKDLYTAATRQTSGAELAQAIYISIAVFVLLVALCVVLFVSFNIFKCIRKKLKMKKYIDSNQLSPIRSQPDNQNPVIQPGTSRDVTVI